MEREYSSGELIFLGAKAQDVPPSHFKGERSGFILPHLHFKGTIRHLNSKI